MQLVITIRKEVADPDEAHQVFEHLKDLLPPDEELTFSGHVTNHFDLEEPQ